MLRIGPVQVVLPVAVGGQVELVQVFLSRAADEVHLAANGAHKQPLLSHLMLRATRLHTDMNVRDDLVLGKLEGAYGHEGAALLVHNLVAALRHLRLVSRALLSIEAILEYLVESVGLGGWLL